MREKKQLELSRRSIANMAAIKKHIATENPPAAERVITEMLKLVEQLVHHPMLGHTGKRAGTRELVMPHYPYTLIYKLTASKIIIVTVYHQRQIIGG